MKDELVPELHDIFKLTKYGHINPDASEQLIELEKRIQHEANPQIKAKFEEDKISLKKRENDYKDILRFTEHIPNNKTWHGIIHHHEPNDYTSLLLHIADGWAAGFARQKRKEGTKFFVYKLWNPPTEEKDARIKDDNDIVNLLKFLNTNPTGEQFFKKYGELLKSMPEEAQAGANITSLLTHVKLSGQFFRILMNNPDKFIIKDIDFNDKNKLEEKIKELERREWELYPLRIRIHFNQKMMRVKDLNVFKIISDIISKLKTEYADNLFYTTSNEIVMFFADHSQLSTVINKFLYYGYLLEFFHDDIKKQEKLNNLLKPLKLNWTRKDKLPSITLEESFNPPICEICQMAKATRHWPVDYAIEKKDICNNCKNLFQEHELSYSLENLCEHDREKLQDILEDCSDEDLCENCFRIRSRGVKLLKLKRWTEENQSKLFWLKLSLDFDNLEPVLNKLNKNYLNSLDSAFVEIKFPVVSEFKDDFQNFTDNFKQEIVSIFTADNIEFVSEDLMCIKIDKLSEMLKALEIYNNLIDKYFPKFKDKEISLSPIKITLVAANPKYPFFEVWDIMENAQDDILVALINRGQMKVKLCDIEPLIKAFQEDYKFQKSALEKLAKVAEISEKLAQLTAQDKNDEDYPTYAQMTQLGLDFKSLLTFAKIMEDR